jgi:hypothetical protein
VAGGPGGIGGLGVPGADTGHTVALQYPGGGHPSHRHTGHRNQADAEQQGDQSKKVITHEALPVEDKGGLSA